MKIASHIHLAASILSFLMASNCFAIDAITEEEIVKLLDSENATLNTRNLEGYMSTFTDDYIHIGRDGKVSDKADTRLNTYNSFMASLHVLHKSILKSAQVATDGKSANAIFFNDSKYLIERFGEKRVIRNHTEESAELILVNGEIKYKKTRFLRDL